MKKQVLGTTLASMILASPVMAFAGDVEISATVDVTSEYVFRGLSLEEAAIQPGIEAALDGFFVGAWWSNGLESRDPVNTDEFNFYAGYGFDLSDTVSASFGGLIFHYPDFGDTFEVNAGLAFDTELSPAITGYYDFDLDTFTVIGELGHSIPIGEQTSFDLGLTAGFAEPDGGSGWQWGQASASVSQELSENISAYVSANYVISSEDTLDFGKGWTEDKLLFFGAGLATGF